MKTTLRGLMSATAVLFFALPAQAVDPNPLQSAYWRFEEGPPGSPVTPSSSEVVQDDLNNNDMRTPSNAAAPIYTSTVAPLPLASGAPNNLALQFGGAQNLHSESIDANNISINNGIIGPPVAPGVTGFTLEAAFRPNVVSGPFQAIVSKEGRPAEAGGGFIANLPTLALKVRGDDSTLQIEQFDKAGNLVDVKSNAPLVANEWYAAAAVNDGSALSLYLNRNDGNGYLLQGSIPVNGALYQGANDDWDHRWAIGKGIFGAGDADFFNGIIDEVRLSNSALNPADFLFARVPEPSAFLLFVLAGLGCACVRRRWAARA